MDIILEAQVSFIFPLLCILFKNLFQILVILKPYVLEKTVIEKALDANECVRLNRGIHCKSGSSFMGFTVNAGLASLMRKAEHSSFLVLIPASTASPIKDDPDLQ